MRENRDARGTVQLLHTEIRNVGTGIPRFTPRCTVLVGRLYPCSTAILAKPSLTTPADLPASGHMQLNCIYCLRSGGRTSEIHFLGVRGDHLTGHE